MATPTPNPPSETLSEQSDPKPALRKPEFKKVDQLKPGTGGHTLTVKVLTSNTVLAKGRSVSQHLRQTRIAECLVGDETGAIVFTARNEQETRKSSKWALMNVLLPIIYVILVDLMQPGATVIIRNAKIDMFKGSMRLAVDKWGRVEITEPANFTVKEDNNLSLIEYELVNVVEE
ncbi:uncharacterized protein At4g28440-like isoform X1 [Juglans microcarpa x Juglans regia]|uniref:uncharacterized protein At4g28440-like isoform X1 n=1 Tax=Juglans microcarpa x Juglans regia TaxID=2249226 RepID=UPI001B7E3211|nr:uncharacterized protein At4g28440-like isoform X1 [Juglans microcarpa x Juglans regia]